VSCSIYQRCSSSSVLCYMHTGVFELRLTVLLWFDYFSPFCYWIFRNTCIGWRRLKSMITGFWVWSKSLFFIMNGGMLGPLVLLQHLVSLCDWSVFVLSAQEAGFFFHMVLVSTTNSWTSLEISTKTGVIKRLSFRLHLAHCVDFRSHFEVKSSKRTLKNNVEVVCLF